MHPTETEFKPEPKPIRVEGAQDFSMFRPISPCKQIYNTHRMGDNCDDEPTEACDDLDDIDEWDYYADTPHYSIDG